MASPLPPSLGSFPRRAPRAGAGLWLWGCHPVIEGSEWPEHHKSPVGNAVAPILQIERLRPREETAPQSKSVSSQIQCSLHHGSSLEEGARVSAWGAGKGLQVMASNQGLQPQTQQGLLPALSPTQRVTSWLQGSVPLSVSSLFLSPLPSSPAHARPILRRVPTC